MDRCNEIVRTLGYYMVQEIVRNAAKKLYFPPLFPLSCPSPQFRDDLSYTQLSFFDAVPGWGLLLFLAQRGKKWAPAR